MKSGDLVRTLEVIDAWPHLAGGEWRNAHLVNQGVVCLVLDEDSYWGEEWVKVVLPDGVGWLKRHDVEAVGGCAR